MTKLTYLIVPFFLTALKAQTPLEVGIFAGTTTYQGDLAEDHLEFKELNFAFGGYMRYHFTPKYNVRFSVIYGHITGSDGNAKDIGLFSRGWSYKSHIVEMSFVNEYHPFAKSRTNDVGLFRKQISPYVAAGVGVANFDPSIYFTNQVDVFKFPEPDAKGSSITIPVILGVKADLHKYVITSMEIGSRLTFNDYLDGISHNGNPKKNDLFIFIGFSVSYYIGYEDFPWLEKVMH